MPWALLNGKKIGQRFIRASDSITSKEYYSCLNHPFVFMLFCHYSYFETFSHELPKISQWPCDVVLNLFFSQGPRILFPLPCGGGLGQCFSCGSLEIGSQILADVWFRNRKGIKRACCGEAAEISAEGREEEEEEEKVATQMQQQGARGSSSSACQ